MPFQVGLGGPGLIVLAVLGVVIWAGSAYVAIDSLRRFRTDYAGVAEGRWFYAVPQIVFFAGFFARQFLLVQAAAPWIATATLVALPFILAQQMAYLLRVVFPTAKRLEKRLEAENAAGMHDTHDEIDEDAAGWDEPGSEPVDDADEFFFGDDDDDSDDRSSTHA